MISDCTVKYQTQRPSVISVIKISFTQEQHIAVLFINPPLSNQRVLVANVSVATSDEPWQTNDPESNKIIALQ
jgi:predicted RNA-binding protein with PIN domain